MRLQPISKSGVTASRSAGSEMPLRMLASASRLAGAASFGLTVKPGTSSLAAPVDPGPVGLLHQREVAEGQPLEAGVGPVAARDDVRRGALVDVEVRGHLRHLGDDLDRRGAGADDGDPLAAQVHVVVPAGRVEDLALEAVDAVDVGQPRLGEPAGAGDERGGGDLAAVGEPDPPVLLLLVPRGVLDGGAEAEPVEDAGPRGDLAQVGVDLGLGRERARPVRVGRERERVELARHVAGRPGVGVVAPGAADVVALLDHEEVGLAVLVELDRRAEAGEAGADHQVPDVPVRGHARHPRQRIENASIGLLNAIQ